MSKLTLNELSNSLNDYIDEKQNVEDYSLMTENKTIVGAINEIYGKEIIANAIGKPLKASDTFQTMSNDINNLLSTFKTNMMNAGVVVESGDKFKALIDKIKGLTEGEGNKGIQFAEGTLGNLSVLSGGYQTNTNVTMNLDFIPNYIFINMNYTINNISGNPSITNMIICNMLNQTVLLSFGGSETYSFSTSITNLSSTGFTINISGSNYGKLYVSLGEYYAIGVGEEDTTLRDSLADILENKGVDVTEEDDMASLISKVDGFIPHPPAIAGDDHIIYENTNVFTGYNQDGIGELISEFNNFKIGGTYRIYFSSHSSGGHSSRPYYEHIRNSTVINTGQTYGGGWDAEVSTFDVPNVLPGDTIRFYMNSSASDWEVDKHGIRCSIDDSYFLI